MSIVQNYDCHSAGNILLGKSRPHWPLCFDPAMKMQTTQPKYYFHAGN